MTIHVYAGEEDKAEENAVDSEISLKNIYIWTMRLGRSEIEVAQ